MYYLEELDPDDGEEEHEEKGDDHNVVDGLHRNDQTLNHLLQTLGSKNTYVYFIYLCMNSLHVKRKT